MNETLKKLLEANGKYAESGSFGGDVSENRRKANAAGQKPYTVVVCCSDSRVVPEALFSAGIGELFVVRTAGNVIGESELGSVEYAVHHLHVGTAVVLGHTHCGAVHAALCGETGGFAGAITRRIKETIGGETDPYRACGLNVRRGVETLKAALGEDGLTVAGAIYDIESGKVVLTE